MKEVEENEKKKIDNEIEVMNEDKQNKVMI